jgi:hypothetical protein
MTAAKGGSLMTRRIGSLPRRPWSLPAVSLAAAALAATGLIAAPATGLAAAHPHAATYRYHDRSAGDLDCNGHSPIQRPLKVGGIMCAEVHRGTGHGRLYDNGYYVGHDEPTIQFYSNQPGSSTDVTWAQTLPRDPRAAPTVHGPLKDVTHFFELMPTLWYSMALCDPRSYPQLPCKPDSNTNSPHGSYPGGGSAFLELQFYPPGFPPYADGLSCDDSHWCAALTIDSLECTTAGVCNNDCVEPVNFAFIQTDGVPTGPPSPQRADVNSVTPNQDTLLMNPGDKLKIRIFDNKRAGALETSVSDLTTRHSGFMLASAKNGFMNTSIANCSGARFSFRPLYSTASHINQGGWAAANINIAYEVGHFTPCTRVQGLRRVKVGNYADPSWQVCRGPYENRGPAGGKDDSDFPCFKAGDTHGPLNAAPDLVTGCTGADLDYDGTSYWADWPDSLTPGRFPSPMTQQQPTTVHGTPYPQIQFLTDNPATNSRCNMTTLAGCVVPPTQAPGHFYPYYTLAKVGGTCLWEYGQMTNGNTFGKDKQYGKATDALGLTEDAGPIMRYPGCG